MTGRRLQAMALRRHGRSADAGFTLVELMVAMALMSIIFAMIGVTFGFLLQQSTSEANATQSGSTAETSLWTLRVPLRYAVTPYVAAVNNDTVPATTTPCWGTSSPAFYPAMPGLPAYAPYPAVAATTAGGAAYNSLVSPEDNAILVAHDFDVVFCAQPAYRPSSSPPNVYRLWVNPTTCTNHTASGGGNCDLQLDDYGPSNTVLDCQWQQNGGQPTTSICSALSPVSTTRVASGIWCNLSCQEDVVGDLGDNQLSEPAMFSYYSSPPSAPGFTSYPIPSPSDVTSLSTGPNLVGIHDIEISISTIAGNPAATATLSNVATSTSSIYLGGTVTTSSTLLDSAPIVSSVTDSATHVPSGRWTGGNEVVITGAGLGDVSSVRFGSVPAIAYTALSSNEILATVPAAAQPGIVDVRVSDPIYGTSSVSTADNYSYLPVVTAVSPNNGSNAGGNTVTITGSGFSGASVYFGAQVATSVTPNSSTSLTAVSPPGSLGVVDVTVYELGVRSAVTQPADQFTYLNLPTVTSVSPDTGPGSGGTAVTIRGTNFAAGSTVKFGTKSATSVAFVNATTITATSSSGSGTVDVAVATPTGSSGASVGDLFTYAAPTVTGVSPNAGGSSGGTQVTVTGTNFVPGATVAFGPAAGASVTVNSSTSITATSPAGSGTVDVQVTTGAGTSTTGANDLFAYGAPTVVAVSPHFGAASGGTTVTITGTNFVPFTAVSFGGTAPLTYTVNSSSSITATSPPGLGTVDVTVTTPDGTSPTSINDLFAFSAPAVNGVSPDTGSSSGGTQVTVTGTNFVPGATVTFGAAGGTSVTVNSSTSLTVTSPAGSGTVDVRVTTGAGTSPTGANDLFAYATPTVTALNAHTGAAGGGTRVTVTGTNFVPGATVTFGAAGGTSVTVNSSTSLTVTSPAGSGTVDVTVTTGAGTSPTGANDLFAYATPTVTALSAHTGAAGGGTRVTVTGTNFVPGATVTFGAAGGTSVTVNSSTSLTVTSPAGSGTVDVTVTTGAGTSPTGLNDLFAYAAPTVTALSAHTGAAGGGSRVTVTGTNFVPGATVAFGTAAGTSVTVNSTTSLTVTSPAGSGTVDVRVMTVAGTSATGGNDLFAYGAPTVTAVSPNLGRTAGGTTVTVTGTNFIPGATVRFGASAGTSVTVNSSTSLTVTSPAGSGTVDVTVTTPLGTSATGMVDQFSYGNPTVTSLSPNAGSKRSTISVTITGTNFEPGATVAITGGGTKVTVNSVTYTSSTSLTMSITIANGNPSGTYPVVVTDPDGGVSTSAGTNNVFTVS